MLSKLVKIISVLAIAIAALLPPSVMLVPGEGKSVFSIVICTSSGLNTISVDASGQETSDKSEQHRNKSCDFAAMHAAMTVPSDEIRVGIQIQYERIIHSEVRHLISQASKPAVVSARGPPTRA